MNRIEKVSDIAWTDLAAYLRLTETDTGELNELESYLAAAKSYVSGYTGKTAEEMDKIPELVIAVLVLCQDMYDNRSAYIDLKNGGAANRTVETILNMHAGNLL